jgi:hypothetical protein
VIFHSYVSLPEGTWSGGFLSHGAAPKHHPFIDGIFHEINHPFLGIHIYGNPHISRYFK